jgi:DNA-binding XRE family transcriptional regulator
LTGIITRGKHSTQKWKRAQVLLRADEGYTDEEMAERAGIHRRGVEGIRQQFVEEGLK